MIVPGGGKNQDLTLYFGFWSVNTVSWADQSSTNIINREDMIRWKVIYFNNSDKNSLICI